MDRLLPWYAPAAVLLAACVTAAKRRWNDHGLALAMVDHLRAFGGRSRASRESQDREFSSLVEHLPDAIARYDPQGRGVFANGRFLDAWSLSARQFLGRTPAEVPGGQAGRLIHARFEEAVATGRTVEFECGPDDGPAHAWLRLRVVPELDRDGRVGGVILVGREVPALNAAEQAMAEARARSLVAWVETDHELEKREIANRLQNDLAQVLAVLGWELKRTQLESLHAAGPNPQLDYVTALADRALRSLLGIVGEMGTPTFDLGVAAALEEMIARYRESYGLRCTLFADDADFFLDEDRILLLYRIIGALLGSVLETTMTAEVVLRLRRRGSDCVLQMEDPNYRPVGGECIGLIVAREFARQLGGCTQVSEQAGLGRIVEISLPIQSVGGLESQ